MRSTASSRRHDGFAAALQQDIHPMKSLLHLGISMKIRTATQSHEISSQPPRSGRSRVWFAFVITPLAAQAAHAQVLTGFEPVLDGPVAAVFVQPDQKILVGGEFTQVNGQARSHLARLNADGTLDPTFVDPLIAGSTGTTVQAITMQGDKIVIGGRFTTVHGESHRFLARLLDDGAVDPEFADVPLQNTVRAVLAQGDALVVGGEFDFFVGAARHRFLIRVDDIGRVDTGFNETANNFVHALAAQGTGILVGGDFTAPRQHFARLNADGTADAQFADASVNFRVRAIALQTNGPILIGGDFTTPAPHIARLLADGSIDTRFDTPGVDQAVYAIGLQPDHRILVGGAFQQVGSNGQTVQIALARFNKDGTHDNALPDPQINGPVHDIVQAIAVHDHGEPVFGGYFTSAYGETHTYVARINQDDRIFADDYEIY
jgi:uncharacterized delta-60 repeat protein